jgi:tRNA pseudouridine38-40 synthase
MPTLPARRASGQAGIKESLGRGQLLAVRRLRFNVAYDGTDFHGWQVQPDLLTIQGVLESVIGTVEGNAVHVEGSGRTDAGVHALAQVAAVTLNNPIPVDNFRRAANRLLPFTIRISDVEETALDFHPRFHARRKTYEYRIFRDEICPPFERRWVCHHPYPLDEGAMISAARLYAGEHDFTAFAAADEKDTIGHSKRRMIYESRLSREGHHVVFRVAGSGFLKHMVRNLAGVLLEIGKGNLSADGLRDRLANGSEYRPGPTAPASGLFLISVEYE